MNLNENTQMCRLFSGNKHAYERIQLYIATCIYADPELQTHLDCNVQVKW